MWQQYLLQSGKVTDKVMRLCASRATLSLWSQDWVESRLKPQIKATMVHVLNAVDGDLEKWPGRFGIWGNITLCAAPTARLRLACVGLDFMLDDDLKLWFMEVNT